jgi:hypothetical protein
LVFLLTVFAGMAKAATFQDAETLYDLGNFRAAALVAEHEGGADALALAARCRLVRAAYLLPRDRAIPELKEAETLARQALAADPGNVEASLDLAIALGYRARAEGYVAAYFQGLAKEAKQLIADAMQKAPDDGWAAAIAGGWNTEIVMAAGPSLAAKLYGAMASSAMQSFKRAVVLDPENPVIRLEYAKAILKLDGDDGRADAAAQLKAALKAPESDIMARMAQEQATKLSAVLAAGGDKEAVTAVLAEIDPFAPQKPKP